MSTNALTRAVAVLFGAGVALAVITAGSVQGHGSELERTVRIVAVPTGELGVAQTDDAVTVRNQTATPLSVRATLAPSSGDEKIALPIQLAAGDEAFDLAPGEARSLAVPASTPARSGAPTMEAALRFSTTTEAP